VHGPIRAEWLDVVPWTHGEAEVTVEFTTNELTATCPITGQPDFYEWKLGYRPRAYLIESKSLKLYLWGFREVGIFRRPTSRPTRGLFDSGPGRCQGRSPQSRAGSVPLVAGRPLGEGLHDLVGGPEPIASAIAARRCSRARGG
jgi:hypothetical protein